MIEKLPAGSTPEDAIAVLMEEYNPHALTLKKV